MSSLATPIAGFLPTIALLLTTTTVTANDDDTHPFLVREMGVDSVHPDGIGFRTLAEQVRAGKVDVRLIDKAVACILDFKLRAGLFENPYGDAERAAEITGDVEAGAFALKAARKSICLLTNDGTLPLAADNSIDIADVTGRHLSEQPELCRTPNTENADRYTHANAAYRRALAEVAQ